MKIESKRVQAMSDVDRIRSLLYHSHTHRLVDDMVYVTCFDKKDAEAIEADLTEAERKLVRYTWLVR